MVPKNVRTSTVLWNLPFLAHNIDYIECGKNVPILVYIKRTINQNFYKKCSH